MLPTGLVAGAVIPYGPMVRRWLLALLVLALPLQGALAASRMCASMHAGAPAAIESAAHAHHGTEHAAHAHDGGTHTTHDHGAPASDHAAGSCNLCSACSVMAALAPAVTALTAVDATYPSHPPLVVSVPRNVADGLERPPRTI